MRLAIRQIRTKQVTRVNGDVDNAQPLLLDRPAKLIDPHGAQQVLVFGQRGCEARMVGASSVEVRPEGDDDRRRPRLALVEEGVDEARPARLVRTEREQLLELIHDQKRGWA